MKKITLFFLIIILIVCLALPVFATETYSYYLPVIDDNWDGDFSIFSVNSFPTVGNYRYEFQVKVYGFDLFFSGVCSAFDSGFYIYIPLSLSDGNYNFNVTFMWIYDPSFLAELGSSEPLLLLVENDSGDLALYLFGSEFELNKIESVGFINSVNSGISSVMSWIQSFANAFFTGKLSPLLIVFVIGICAAALFFGIRSIYKFSWGC